MESAVTKKRTDVVKKKKRGYDGEVGEEEDKKIGWCDEDKENEG